MDEIIRLIRQATELVVAAVAAHQYPLLFIIVAIEEAGVPLPAPSDLVIAYYGDRARGNIPELAGVVLICAAASTVGTLLPYAFARRFGEVGAKKLARWIDVEPKHVDGWTERIGRHGFSAVLVGRLIPGLRVAMSLVAGTAKVPLVQFSLAVFIAATAYWTVWVSIGVLAGPTVRHFIAPGYIRYVVIGLPVVFIGYLVYRHMRGRRKHAAAQAAGGAT
ncbi:MAG: DedA family protein [Chloroflexota bacterium]|nr:DedA family protein [Chloroflexota bacterium]